MIRAHSVSRIDLLKINVEKSELDVLRGLAPRDWPRIRQMVIEVDQLEDRYRRAVEKGLPIKQELQDQYWGHRSFCVREPNGLTLNFFSELESG